MSDFNDRWRRTGPVPRPDSPAPDEPLVSRAPTSGTPVRTELVNEAKAYTQAPATSDPPVMSITQAKRTLTQDYYYPSERRRGGLPPNEALYRAILYEGYDRVVRALVTLRHADTEQLPVFITDVMSFRAQIERDLRRISDAWFADRDALGNPDLIKPGTRGQVPAEASRRRRSSDIRGPRRGSRSSSTRARVLAPGLATTGATFPLLADPWYGQGAELEPNVDEDVFGWPVDDHDEDEGDEDEVEPHPRPRSKRKRKRKHKKPQEVECRPATIAKYTNRGKSVADKSRRLTTRLVKCPKNIKFKYTSRDHV